MKTKLVTYLFLGVFLAPSIALSQTIAAWGDSLTAGTGGVPWTQQFEALSGVTTLNFGVGGNTSTQIATRFFAAPSTYNDFTVIWAGQNNPADASTVESDIALMVSKLTTPNYLILGVINGDYSGYESVGEAGYSIITGLNSQLDATYGSKFIDIRSVLVNSYNPNLPQDVSDFSQDIVPASLRSDNLHLNTAGYGIVAKTIYQAYSACVVPLPSTAWLFGSGLLGLIGVARRKARS